MNISLEITSWPYFFAATGMVGIIFFAIRLLVNLTFRKVKPTKANIVGIVASGLIFTTASFAFLNQDWSIPECYDESGKLIEDNPKCQYP